MHTLDTLIDLPLEELKSMAAKTCAEHFDAKVYLRALLEISNRCSKNCAYCGINASNTKVPRYKMEVSEIVECVKKAFNEGYRTFVLQSGEGAYSDSDIARIIESIKQITGEQAALTLSLGVRPLDVYRLWKEAGANRYLLRFETSNQKIFRLVKQGHEPEERLRALEDLKSLGYETGTGFLIGLPEESEEDFYNNLKLTLSLKPHMTGIGPFIPHPETALGSCEAGNFSLVMRATAILRILRPDINIPASTASSTLAKEGRVALFGCGANVVMPNVTPARYRNAYELYPGKVSTDMRNDFDRIKRSIHAAGKVISFERGDSPAHTSELHHHVSKGGK